MGPKRVNSIIAALLEQLHVEKIVNADALGGVVDAVNRDAIDRVVKITVGLKEASLSKILRIGKVLSGLPEAYERSLKLRLEKLNKWASDKAALIFTREVPRTWMAAKVRQNQKTSGLAETPLDKIHEMPKSEYEQLVKRYVLPPRKKADIQLTMSRPVTIVKADGTRETLAWDDRIRNLSNVINPEVVADKIVQAHTDGKSSHELAKMLVDETRGIGHSARRIARTESMRQMGDEERLRYEQLGDMYIGLQYVATLDQVVRPEHAILHGRIWWKDKMPYLGEMPMPPIAPNCRCSTQPVLAPPDEALSDPTYLAELRAATANNGPDIQTQQQWWAQADEGRRKLSVGAKRYNRMREHMGRDPDWVDFVNVDGGFIKLDTLLKESDEARSRRRMAILMTIGDQGRLAADVSRMGFAI